MLLDSLSRHIPIILLPLPRTRVHFSLPANSNLSVFRSRTPIALRAGLFRSPETLAALRVEAAERFLGWREVERAVRGVEEQGSVVAPTGTKDEAWSKAQ